MTLRITPLFSALIAGLGWATSQNAHATACPMGILCDEITLDLQASREGDGRWRYDYTVKDRHVPYNPGGPEIPESIGYAFVEFRLPYFEDAGIADIRVGSQYAGQLTVQVSDDDLGRAGRSIVLSAVGRPVSTISPAAVVSGVNSLLSFIADYAPAWNAPATLTLVNIGDGLGPTDKTVLYKNIYSDPAYQYPRLSGAVGAPGSPSAVPEADSMALTLAGLTGLAFARSWGRRLTR